MLSPYLPALLQPAQIARQAEHFALDDVEVELAGGARLRARAPRTRRAGCSPSYRISRGARSDCAARGWLRPCRARVCSRASRSKPRLSHGCVEVAPLGQRPCGHAQRVERLALSRSSRQTSRASARVKAGDGDARRCSIQRRKTRAEDAQRVRLRQFLEHRIDARFHRPPAQQLRAERVDGADEGAIERARRVGEARANFGIRLVGAAPFQLVADAQLHVAGRGVRERHRDDLLHRRAAGDDFDDALDQRGGLARARRGFDDPALVRVPTAGVLIATPAVPSSPSTPAATSRAPAPLRKGRRPAGTRSPCSRPCAARREGIRRAWRRR